MVKKEEEELPQYSSIRYNKEKGEYEYDTDDVELSDKDLDVEEELPESEDVSIYKYQVEADIPKQQKATLDQYRPFYGRHTALANTKRSDNPRILDGYDVAVILDDCPTLRHRATQAKGRVLTEIQLFRSNNGFERRMESTVIKEQALDIADNRYSVPMEEKKRRFGLFRRKK